MSGAEGTGPHWRVSAGGQRAFRGGGTELSSDLAQDTNRQGNGCSASFGQAAIGKRDAVRNVAPQRQQPRQAPAAEGRSGGRAHGLGCGEAVAVPRLSQQAVEQEGEVTLSGCQRGIRAGVGEVFSAGMRAVARVAENSFVGSEW
jgi:hypothetical protein